MIRKQNEAYLYRSDKDTAVLKYQFEGVDRYTLNSFYVCGNDYKVPISIVKYFPWMDAVYNNVIAVGLAGTTPTPPQTFSNNKALLVSKEFFAYNPKNYYRLRVKGVSTGSIQCGFITWTSSPITDLLQISDDENINAMYNISRFAMAKDGLGILPSWDSGQSLADLSNNNMIDKGTTAWFNDYDQGYIARYEDPEGTGTAFDISDFMSAQDRVLYFSPYVYCNTTSTLSFDGQVTYIDDIIVEEFWDTYTI